MTNINEMTGSELVEYHNQLIEQLGRGAKVNRFSDRKTALKRIERVQQELAAKPAAKIEFDEPQDKTPTPHKPAKRVAHRIARKASAEPKPAKTEVEAKPKKGKRTYRFVMKPRDEIKAPRETTKRYTALQLLLRPEGTTFAEVLQETGWIELGNPKGPRTCYEAIRLLNIQHGYGLDHRADDRIFAYEGKVSPVAREEQKR